MDLSLGDIIALIIIGILAGTAAAQLVYRDKRQKSTSALLRNTFIGLAGALVGSLLFRVLDISLPEALQGSITVADILTAFIGAVVVIALARLISR
ncbi:MAG: GlsB/YeaQ/YmgE family stress response membrane protein [Anaerolineales bacterium]